MRQAAGGQQRGAEQQPTARRSARRMQVRYLAAVTPARLASDGAGIALALAATEALHDVAVGAALIVALTAPSVLAAPLIGGALDGLRSPRRVIALAAVVLAAALALAAGIGTVPVPVLFVAVFVGGWALPVFLGGMSSFVGDLMPGDVARGYALDAFSYNISGLGGPAVVALVASVASPRAALLTLAAATLVSGVLTALLPIRSRGESARLGAIVRGIGVGTRYLATHRPLTLATAAGSISQVGAGAAPIAAIALAIARGGSASGAGWLVTAIELGGLVGALATTFGPLARIVRDLPLQPVMCGSFAFTGAATLVAAFAPGYAATFVALAVSGLTITPAVQAMFRIRREQSPEALRGQVFIVGAGMRVAASAVGAGLIGLVAHAPAEVLTVLVAIPWLASGAVLLLPPRARAHPVPAD